MADALDMSLEDLIAKSRSTQQRPGGRGPASRGGGGGGGPAPTAPQRRFNTRAAAAPYLRRAAFPFKTPHSRPMAYGAAGYMAVQPPHPPMVPAALDEPTKLYISNLDHGVSNEDIKELFSDVGEIKRYSINYDRSGRSKGTAEVVFSRRSDALVAVRRYNNVQLDGKSMKIEIIGTSIEAPPPPPPPVIFSFNPPALNFDFPFKSGPGRGGAVGWPQSRGGFGGHGRGRGGRGGGRGRGRGRGRGEGRGEKVSAEDLDADLDKYHAAK